MTIQAGKFLLISILALTYISASGQVKKASPSTKAKTVADNSRTKVKCYYCHGSGVSVYNINCNNCRSWSAEYKKKVACQKCKDKRTVWRSQKCAVCNGTGKTSVTAEELVIIQENERIQKKDDERNKFLSSLEDGDIPTDLEARALYLAYGYGGVMLGNSSEEEKKPLDDLISEIKQTREGQSEKVNSVLDSLKKIAEDVKKVEEARKEAAKLKEEEERIAKEKKEKIEQLNREVVKLKDFFATQGLQIWADSITLMSIIIQKAEDDKITLQSFQIKDGLLIDTENSAIYNREALLLYQGSAPIYTMQLSNVNGTSSSYLLLREFIEYAYTYRYILRTEKGKVLLNLMDKNATLYQVSPSLALEEFDVNKLSKSRLWVIRYLSPATRDLSDVQYEYQIVDLLNGTSSKMLNGNSLKRNIERLLKKS